MRFFKPKVAKSTRKQPTTAAETCVTLDLNDAKYYEIIRRIPEPKRIAIEATLKEVTSAHIASLLAAMANQQNLMEDTSFIHDEIFPFAALQAVRMGEISPLQFGTLMALWGSLKTILPKPSEQVVQTMPEFVPLFTVTGEKNPHASTLLLRCLQPSAKLPHLVVKTPEELLKGIYDKAIHLPQSEQGFWIVEDIIRNTNTVGVNRIVTHEIKLYVNFLAFNANEKREMIPSFGLQQVLLDVAFPHAVRINPVIGKSTPIDIRKGSLERYRDIALPFPGNELPKVVDSFSAPSVLDFMFHDRYHAVRASRVTPEETAHYVAIGDNLNIMQKRYDAAVKELSKRHDEHIRLLPKFGKAIEKLPVDKQREVTEQAFKKFKQEMAIINNLKKMRKLNGQLKFRLWDMERAYSGSVLDGFEKNTLQELIRILSSIEIDLDIFKLSKYSGRRVAHAVLEAVKPEAATLTAMQNLMRQSRPIVSQAHLLGGTVQSAGQLAFDDAIIEAPVHLPQQSPSL